jgi:hypothetical protein
MKRWTRKQTVTRILLALAGLAALFATLSTGTGMGHVTEDAPVRADPRSETRSAPSQDWPRAGREAHSDGGYWYWLEHQDSSGNSH